MSKLTMSNIGLNGRLGNQMFQYAILYKLSRSFGIPISIPIFQSHNKYENFELGTKTDPTPTFPNVVKTYEHLNSQDTRKTIVNYTERGLGFDYEANKGIDNFVKMNSSEVIVNVTGYYQSYRYFDDIRQEIKNLYQFDDTIVQKCKFFLEEISGENSVETISVHVRRGDYTNPGTPYAVQTPDFIRRCMSNFNHLPQKHFIFFSDDIEWCKKNFSTSYNGAKISYSPFTKGEYDMCCMTLCNHNIIAPSSFSWWAAYLNANPNKIVICPKSFFNSSHPTFGNIPMKDLIMPKWINF